LATHAGPLGATAIPPGLSSRGSVVAAAEPENFETRRVCVKPLAAFTVSVVEATSLSSYPPPEQRSV
jgi:hypothetical protein